MMEVHELFKLDFRLRLDFRQRLLFQKRYCVLQQWKLFSYVWLRQQTNHVFLAPDNSRKLHERSLYKDEVTT